MYSRFVLPKPISQDDHIFEELVCDVMSRRLNCRNLQRYGRHGQKQHGVDVVGITTLGVTGIQCKHHPITQLTTQEIDIEITKSEAFSPRLSEFYIVTSAERDAVLQSYVTDLSAVRLARGDYPVLLVSWAELVDWLNKYPDLVYKYFSLFFPSETLEKIYIPLGQEVVRETLAWKFTDHELQTALLKTVSGLSQVSPYQLNLGYSTFQTTNFMGLVDIAIEFRDFFKDEANAEVGFAAAAGELNQLKMLISGSEFSREIWIYLESRLTAAFLLGWTFRKVTGSCLKIVSHDDVWATDGLPTVPSNLMENLPTVLESDNSEVAVVLSISRDIKTSVEMNLGGWRMPPRYVLTWTLESHTVRNAAHALSLAREIANKLKFLMDSKGVTHIHLFAALPAALAVLIGYHLNAIRPVSIYFLDSSRETYALGGQLHNNL